MASIYETTDHGSNEKKRSVAEDCRQEQAGCVPGWPVEWTRVNSGTPEAGEFTQQRHSDWLPPSRSPIRNTWNLEYRPAPAQNVPKSPRPFCPEREHKTSTETPQRYSEWLPPSRSLIRNTRNVEYRPAPAQNGPKSPRPVWPEREHDTPTETEAWGSAGIPVKWVELRGFPRRATEKILKSFHAVGTILKIRETPDAIRLRYLDRMGLYRAMQLDGKRISGFHVVVKPILGDPQESDPIVYPTEPQFPHMHPSWTQRIGRLCGWKGKFHRFAFAFFLLFTLFLRFIWW
ncbi:GL17710 [Drosophila persimilis]|uniref:GL17710 n=1 Tax=Drosophila persimilis TaxID=7234 RepID=B4GIG4_DROPE|nr:GL17710 [Drosophila persimilis]